MLGKFIASQIFGIPAAILSSIACSELFGITPLYAPLAAWLLTSLYVIAKL